jgi:sedoheptulose-bisphosphatase
LYAQALKHSHFCKYACSEEIPELQDMGGPVEGLCHNCTTLSLKILIMSLIQKYHFFEAMHYTEYMQLITGGFSVAFDPLDGSSIVDTNFTVGTIFGVFLGEKLIGVTGRDQVAAAVGVLGPRTTYVLALKDFPGTHEFLLLDEGKTDI